MRKTNRRYLPPPKKLFPCRSHIWQLSASAPVENVHDLLWKTCTWAKPDLQHVGDDRVTSKAPHEVIHGSAVEARRLAHVHAFKESLGMQAGRLPKRR